MKCFLKIVAFTSHNLTACCMKWISIVSEEEVRGISASPQPAIIYKHSPRCMTSLMAYRQLKMDVNAAQDVDLPIYMVDVISNRRESQAIAETFQTRHESPQILVVKGGECLYNASHEDISLKETLAHIH
jgi:bacillithiol system protein YtxJ